MGQPYLDAEMSFIQWFIFNFLSHFFQKLVNEVFQLMWFTPLGSRDASSSKLVQKVMNITDVVSLFKHENYLEVVIMMGFRS